MYSYTSWPEAALRDTPTEGETTDAGFQIDYQWQLGKGKAVFIVAKKTE